MRSKGDLKSAESCKSTGMSRSITKRSGGTNKEETMSSKIKSTLIVILALIAVCTAAGPAMAVTNTAVDGGGTITLTASGAVTVVTPATASRLVKQVYVGGTCMASSIAAGADSCNGGATSVTVPAGTAVEFLIYVRNETDVQLSDIRFIDDIDDTAVTGFTYAGGDLITTTPIGSLETDAAAASAIYTYAKTGATAQTDAVNTGAEQYVSVTDGGQAANLDYVTVGAVAGQANETLNIPARKTFAVLIPVTKN